MLMRVAGHPAGRVLVYDRHEWVCFLDGVRKGEFDDAAGSPAGVTLADAAPGGQQRASCLRLPAVAGGLAVKPACELVIVLCATVIIKFVNHNFSSDMLEAMPCQEGDRG